jgi:hypothetical protein
MNDKPLTPQQRTRAKKRAADLVPYEAWVHKTNLEKLKTVVKQLQIPVGEQP